MPTHHPAALDAEMLEAVTFHRDRHELNLNAVVGDGGFHCLDFSFAMALRGLVANTRYDEAKLLGQIRRNPLYAPGIDPEPFVARLRSFPSGELRELVASLPEEWLPVAFPSLVGGLRALLDEAAVLRGRLEAQRRIRLETDEDRHRRSLASKAEFERRFGKL